MANGARARKEARKLTHGWFNTDERPGDRTLEQQLTGLDPLFKEVKGKTVLDIGCAEGLISMECVKAGAIESFGIDFVKTHIEYAEKLRNDLPCQFAWEDANDYEPKQQYDIVLLLAVLHKLKSPSASCYTLARAAKDLCVIRLSPSGSLVVSDARSGYYPHDIGGVMNDLGFKLEGSLPGPLGEMTHYFRRIKC